MVSVLDYECSDFGPIIGFTYPYYYYSSKGGWTVSTTVYTEIRSLRLSSRVSDSEFWLFRLWLSFSLTDDELLRYLFLRVFRSSSEFDHSHPVTL